MAQINNGLDFTDGQWYNSDGTLLGTGVSFIGGGLGGAGSPTASTFSPVVKGSVTAGAPVYTLRRGKSNTIASRAFVDLEVEWTGHTGDGGLLVSGMPKAWTGAYTPAANEATGCPILVRRRIPNRVVNLATYGGIPGALAATIKTAIANALTALKAAGGGTLLIPPGIYDMGASAVNGYEFLGAQVEMSNIRISGYGALFTFQTTAAVITYGIVFVDGQNIELEGLQFRDTGYDSSLSWKGAHAVMSFQTSAFGGVKGFRMRDCYATSCLSPYAVQGDAAFLLSDVDVQAVADNCYYGLQLDGVTNVTASIVTTDARRSAIAYNCNNMTLTVDATNTAAGVGSNGWVELAARADDDCGNWKVNLTYRGDVRHGTLVRVEHQGLAGTAGTMDNVDLTLTVDNPVNSGFASDAIKFTHDAGGGVTNRVWSNFRVHGQFLGDWLAADKVTNPEISATGSSIALDASVDDLTGLPAYFTEGTTLVANATRTNPQLQAVLLDRTSNGLPQAGGTMVVAQIADNGTDIQLLVNDGSRGGLALAELPETGLLRISGSYPA